MEGQDGPFDLTFYDPVPTQMLPNDDLDLQVVWACTIDSMDKPQVDRMALGQAWLDHVRFPWDEYGAAIRNLRNGLQPPTTGSYDNWFTRGMGAAIRSELWACLAPGDPQLAAAYAYEDACVDHAGEGIWAEVFFAALQSIAFVESNQDKLLDAAISPLPPRSEIRQALQQTRLWWSQSKDWRAVRQKILDQFGQENFTDVVMNVAFTVLGWLAGEGDFSRSICIAVNCGKDTDCTGATVGALMGIIDPKCIGQDWRDPIGRKLVLNKQIVGINPPATLDGFTDMVINLRQRLEGRRPPPHSNDPQSTERLQIPARTAFVSAMPVGDAAPAMPPNTMDHPLAGAWTRWDAAQVAGEVLLVEYPFFLDKRRQVRVMFDSHSPCRVWIDETHAFTHNGGRMCPSLHRAPAGHYRDMNLAQGEHLLRAAVARPKDGRPMEWVVAIGDAQTHQWLNDALLDKSQRPPETRFNSRWRQ